MKKRGKATGALIAFNGSYSTGMTQLGMILGKKDIFINPRLAATFLIVRVKHLLKYNKLSYTQFVKIVSLFDLQLVLLAIQSKLITHHQGEKVLREKIQNPGLEVKAIIEMYIDWEKI